VRERNVQLAGGSGKAGHDLLRCRPPLAADDDRDWVADRDTDEASLISGKGGTDEWRPDFHHRLVDGPCPRIQPRLGSDEPRTEDIADLPDRPGRVRPNSKITFGRDAQPDRRDHEHPVRHHQGGPVSLLGARKGAVRRVPGNRGAGGVRRVLAWIVSPTFSSGRINRTRLDASVIQ
jgi:hypothetical protein